MNGTISKVLKASLFILLGISFAFAMMFYFGGVIDEEATYLEPIYTNLFIQWGEILTVAAAILAIVFAIVNIVLNPKGAVKSLIGIVAFALVIVIAYSISSDNIVKFQDWENFYFAYFNPAEPAPPEYTMEEVKSFLPGLSKNVGTGLITMYILFGLAVLSLLFSEIHGFIKARL